jgi:hypothetical protein
MAERFGSEFEVMPETYLIPEEQPAFHTALAAKPGLWMVKNLRCVRFCRYRFCATVFAS